MWLNKIWFRIRYYRYLKFKKTRLKKYSSYHKTFDHFYFVEKIRLKDLKIVLNEIIVNKNLLKRLPKQISEYRNFLKLIIDIDNCIRKYKVAKKVIDSNRFPKSFKIEIKKKDPLLIRFIDFYFKNRHTIDREVPYYKKYSKMLKFVNENSSFQIEDCRLNLLNRKLETVKKIKDCKILKIDFEKFVLIVEVASYEAMSKIGASSWCITNEKDSWKEYVNKKKQIIIWNFSILDTHPKHIIGITFNDKKEQIVHAFDNENEKIKTGKVYKYIVSLYGSKIHHK